ncbi:MAG: hypothetical protein PHI66_04355 [Candidatus Pacebacteria bacterium]|nr:hypothetical protein [Candidatus Paceibacterota bacterium]
MKKQGKFTFCQKAAKYLSTRSWRRMCEELARNKKIVFIMNGFLSYHGGRKYDKNRCWESFGRNE